MQKLLVQLCIVFGVSSALSGKVLAEAEVDASLQAKLDVTYVEWRDAMIKKNYQRWAYYTASHRKVAIKNRILSEQKAFPGALFSIPVRPPTLKDLKALRISSKGPTATAVYFGKIDFGVGGDIPENLLVVTYVNEGGMWKYSEVDFIRLNELKEVRAQLKAGNLKYVNQPAFAPDGKRPVTPIEIRGARYIAKVYVFCPGREVRMKVNKISDHRFQDTNMAEIVIGGANNGLNEVQFATKNLEGSTGKEPISIRVYLMSTIPGVKPVKVYEYQVAADGIVKPFGSGNFMVNEEVLKKMNGK